MPSAFRMYTKDQMKENNYKTFMYDLGTKLITNKNIKETLGKLLEPPTDYSTASKIIRQYDFKT